MSDKPVIAYVSPHAPNVGSVLTARGVPAYTSAESCASALSGLLQSAQPLESEVGTSAGTRVDIRDFPAGSLDEAHAKALFTRFGIAAVAERIVRMSAEAEAAARELGGQVVLKLLSSEITHKSDVGGVAINLTPDTIGARLTTMMADVEAATGQRPQRFLVQEMVSGGIELILGMHRDPLGTAVLLGMGGVTAELFKDTTMRLLPPEGGLSRSEALSMVHELITWPLLDGFRGRPKADVEALVSAIVAFSVMVRQLGECLIEAEINPVFVLSAGKGVRAADGVVVLGASNG
jgi:acyl-CoA synthetase (NDP forming)